MSDLNLAVRRRATLIGVASWILLVWTGANWAQDVKPGDRAEVLRLCAKHMELDALPLLEKLHKADPADREIQETLACSLCQTCSTLEGDLQAASLLRARRMLEELKAKAPLTTLGETMLQMIPPDGHIRADTTKKEAAVAMTKGEAAFARRDFDKARASYELALAYDPKFYRAAVCAGDTYFAQGKMDEAGAWFARAAKLDPNSALAYRYWGDALMKQGRQADARDKFVAAVVAEPYSRLSAQSLTQWGKVNNVPLTHPGVLPPLKVDGNPDDAAEDGTLFVIGYQLTRQAWKDKVFKETFPDAPAYRHTLDEERAALAAVALMTRLSVKSGKIKTLNPLLANLVKLDDEGFLDAYILLARADEGISKDYEAYRAKNREKLLDYLSRYVAPMPDKSK